MSALGHVGAGAAGTPAKLEKPRKRWLPYLLLLPGGLWLILFFAVPSIQLFATSLYDPSGSLEEGYAMTWQFSNYADAASEYLPHFLRSLGYAALTTVICVLLGYPLAYAIALKGGRWKNLLLICVIAPFFTSFLIRTLAWKVILSDNGWLVTTLNTLHVPLPDGRLLATTPAVIAGLVYNFLPFMVLPLYASLEKLDPRLLEAAGDLYARPVARFTRVALPLSMPGVVAGTLLTFIPAAGDYINAQLLGTNRQYMIGNVIQSKFLRVGDYPNAAALSFTLMAAILVLVFVYVRRAGTDEVL
ncbi:ABC transporter permease [Dactylosporangium sp. NPDC005555]|uniref:ABC transporter permease n=1 Tax=Dactylosporangium sp. NPDC005555 TaxID=3154889 RepID=UPI0033BE24B5